MSADAIHTMQLPQSLAELLGALAFQFSDLQPMLPTYTHLIAAALLPIYAGAYSSLSRPSSAAKPAKRKNPTNSEDDDQDDDQDDQDDQDQPNHMESLSPSDALMFPLLAGATLTGLYFLIKWLDDPALLNKILNWYFATFSVFSVARLVSDALDVLHSLAFPHEFLDRSILFRVNPRRRLALPFKQHESTEIRLLPLPGPFSRLPLPRVVRDTLWLLHLAPIRRLTFTLRVHERPIFDLKLGIHGLEGLAAGLCTVLYYNLVSKPWALTNLMGLGFAYNALQLMSPTTFATGSLILGALFCYDVYFVFFTPMMVTVAKSLDIPVKLLFPRPPGEGEDPEKVALSMLGLGDVVLPGMMVGLALRFDSWCWYRGLQRGVTRPLDPKLEGLKKEPGAEDAGEKTNEDETGDSGIIKQPYASTAEAWGDRLWTSRPLALLLSPSSPYLIVDPHGSAITSAATQSNAVPYAPRASFPKPYFYAALVGYTLGMVITLAAMQISEHPQPALLYLVPGVVGCLWGTGWWRGEVAVMWSFSDGTEDDGTGSEKKKPGYDERDKGRQEQREDAGGRPGLFASLFSTAKSEARAKQLTQSFFGVKIADEKERRVGDEAGKGERRLDGSAEQKQLKVEQISGSNKGEQLLSFTITAPPPLPAVNSKGEFYRLGAEGEAVKADEGAESEIRPMERPNDEHVDKKARVE